MRHFLIVFLLFYSLYGIVQAQVDVFSAEVSFVFESKDVNGTIGGFISDSHIDLEDLENSRFSGTVMVNTLKTGNFIRDWSLKGSKYFDEEGFPEINFRSNAVVHKADGFLVSGTLTIKGVSRPLDIHFNKKENQLLGKASLYSSDYGVTIKNKREDNLVVIEIRLNLSS